MTEREDIRPEDIRYFASEGNKVLDANPVKLSAFQAALLSGVLDLLKKHPTDEAKEFLLRLIESRAEAGFKMKAAQVLARMGDESVVAIVNKVVGQTDARSDYADIEQDIRDRIGALNSSAAKDNRDAHFSWLWIILAFLVMSSFCLGLRGNHKQKKRK
jgi:hypothetical protein